jgi:transcriptional regulator with XRE-family HTH domain
MRETLIAARRGKGYSQAETADKLNITRSHYTKIESEKRDPSLDVMRRISDLFGRSVDELFVASTSDTTSLNRKSA